MVVVLIQARYLDEQPLTNFLTAVFETQYTMIVGFFFTFFVVFPCIALST